MVKIMNYKLPRNKSLGNYHLIHLVALRSFLSRYNQQKLYKLNLSFFR